MSKLLIGLQHRVVEESGADVAGQDNFLVIDDAGQNFGATCKGRSSRLVSVLRH